MEHQDEHKQDITAHKKMIDAQIKRGIDQLMRSGDVKEEDFYFDEHGDKMIKINDQEGVEIVFNYTKGRLYSYGGRINEY